MISSAITSEWQRNGLLALGIVVMYVITARLGFQLATVAEQVTTIWAPTGLALAALLLWGARLWPAVWLGAFVANAVTAAPLWTAAVIATGNTLEALLAVWLLRRDPAFDARLRRLRDAVRLIIWGAGTATALGATIGVTTLCLAAEQPWSRFSELWAAWWLGDALGALVVAPAILISMLSWHDRSRQTWLQLLLLVVGGAAVTHAVFGQTFSPGFGQRLLHYVMFPLVIVAAVRFGQPATALVILAVSTVAIVNTAAQTGPFASPQLHRSLVLLQTFMGVLAGTGLMLSAAMSDRIIGQRRRGAAHGIGAALVEARDLQLAAPAILRRVCENLDWQIGALWLVDQDAGTLRCSAVWSEPGLRGGAFEQATCHAEFASGAGLPGRVWASGRSMWITDVVIDADFPRAAAAAEAAVHGAIGVPIRVGSEVVGVVEFFTRDIAAPDEDLLATMATIGDQLGQFIGRTRVEAAVFDEQRRTRAILDSALDAVISMDHHGLITEFNPAAERSFGYRKDQALGRELADLIIPPDLRQQHRAGLARHLATGEGPFLNRRVESRGYHADGHEFPIEIAIIRVSEGGQPRFTGFVRDLTARRLAEDAVHTSEERFRTLAASNSALTLFEHDHELRYCWVFPQHPEFPEYNIGKTDEELLLPGEGARLLSLKKRVFDSGIGAREEISVTLPDGVRSYDLMVEPRRDHRGIIVGVSGVAVDITERQRTEQLLRDSEARLREADRHKDEFLAMLAHELRNPLAPIRTGLEVMRLAGAGSDAIERVRPMMERQLGHMVRLVDDLLDVSRISSGKIQLRRQSVALAEVVAGAVEANRAAIEAAGSQLEVRLPDSPVLLEVDLTRFVQVLSNLLHNAAKFTDRGGRITVSAEVTGATAGSRHLVLSVSDTGIGISTDMLPRVFDLFTQAEHIARPQMGLGIGLALARRIVELHGGQIHAHSGGTGSGSTFTIQLPIFEHNTAPPERVSPQPEDGTTARRVLVIDDNEDAAETLAALVRAMGGEAATAHDGAEGLRRLSTFLPEVVFLDIGMPAMDGYEVCRRIRRASVGPRPIIVAVTGWGQDRDQERAAKAGFDAHLTKPADPADLKRFLLSDVKHADI